MARINWLQSIVDLEEWKRLGDTYVQPWTIVGQHRSVRRVDPVNEKDVLSTMVTHNVVKSSTIVHTIWNNRGVKSL